MIDSSPAVASMSFPAGFLSLATAMQTACRLYQLESRMAAQRGVQRPASVINRIDALFGGAYAKAVNPIGLERTGKTPCVLRETNLTQAMKTTDPSELPRHFAYDPSALLGKGAVIQI